MYKNAAGRLGQKDGGDVLISAGPFAVPRGSLGSAGILLIGL